MKTVRRLTNPLRPVFIVLAILSIVACEKEDERQDNGQELHSGDGNPMPGQTATEVPQTSQPVSTGSAGPGVAPATCTQSGTAWVAAPGENVPSACGEPLAEFKPCLEHVLAYYPQASELVTQKHSAHTGPGSGLTLYAVSNANGKITMHYAKMLGAGFQYASIFFETFAATPSEELPECRQEHNVLPGLNDGPVATPTPEANGAGMPMDDAGTEMGTGDGLMP